MQLISLVSLVLIACGAVIMSVSIRRFGPEASKLKQVSEEDYLKIKPFAAINTLLMVFFLVGYAAVGISIVLHIRIIGELFVGMIFFSGAIFVLLGILLQSRMTASLKTHYDRAMEANADLEIEREQLSRLNDRLSDEIIDRKQAQKALTASKRFLQTIIDSLPQQLMVINRDYSIALANRTALDSTGLKALSDTIHCHQISHHADAPCTGEAHPCPLEKILKTGKPVTTEHVHMDMAGNSSIVEIVATPIFDASGEINQIVESCRDITMRRQAEDQLRESEQKYRNILESIEDGYFETRLDGTITFVNPAMCTIMGYEKDQLLGKTYRDFSSAGTASKMYHQFKSIYDTGDPFPISTFEVITGRGGSRRMELNATMRHDRKGQPDGFRGIVRDVTELAKARKALEESEERYRMLSEVTMEGICFNEESVILDVNDAFARMFGYDREELVGMHAAQKLLASESWAQVEQIDRTHSTRTYEAMGLKKDGTFFPIEIEGRRVQYKGRQVRVASVRDITERKQVERRIAMAQKMEAIGTLAGGIAHDFNNILAAIMGYSEISMLQVEPQSELSSHLQNILQASHRARDLVAQILTFSRSEAGEARPVQVGPIIKEALKLLKPSIPATIEIAAQIEPRVGQINADPTQIHQIVMNLCTNAAHAMRASGGKLTIRLSSTDGRRPVTDPMAGALLGSYVCLIVSDTGTGMNAKIRERIFEPYFTTKEKGEGTGLGLSVVHGIVQQYNGWMDVDSQPGRGTIFSIFFPKIDPAASVAAPLQQSLPTGNETVLIVDDDDQIVTITSEMLGSLGYRVTPSTSVREALEIFETVPDSFDLVITDQTMPGMTGEVLSRRLREIRPDIPVIICSGYSETMDPAKAESCGLNGFLMKPFEMSELARLIRRVLDGGIASTTAS